MIRFCDSIIDASSTEVDLLKARYNKANALLQLGEEQKAIDIYEDILSKTSPGDFEQRRQIMKDLAVAYLRLGERMNCIHNHSAESCIYPIAIRGVHQDKTVLKKLSNYIKCYWQMIPMTWNQDG